MTATVIQMSIQRMVCTACGAEASASCNCGVSYAPKSARAAEAIKANPEKSDRAIAAEIGVSHTTVQEAREATGNHLPVERTGLDGKTRKLPERKSIKQEAPPDNEPEEDVVAELDSIRKDYVDLLVRVNKLKDRNSILTAALQAKETQEGRNWPADMTTRRIKARDNCLKQITAWQRSLEQLYGEVTGCPSWRVELTTKDGTHMGNQVRFGTRGEAEFYQAQVTNEIDCESSEVIACKDGKANVSVDGDNVYFRHGDCVLFNWRPLAGAP
jgi:hypothetical protein